MTAILFLNLISSANISDLFTIGIPLFRATITSGFVSETAVEITTTDVIEATLMTSSGDQPDERQGKSSPETN